MKEKKQISKMRLAFILLFLFLTLTEVFIALFVRDSFIRPYFSDVLVVIVIYAFIRIFLPIRPLPLLPVAVFLFSVLVEIGQYIGIVDILGLGHISFFRILIGTSFSWIDIICYLTGCISVLAFEILWRIRSRKN